MSWTRGPLAVLAVCVLVPAGLAGCDSGGDRGEPKGSPAPVGRLLDDRDQQGRAYREVEPEGAPGVGVQVQPAAGAWDVRLTVRNFRFSPAGAAPRAVAGRGLAHLYVDGRLVARLRTPQYRLAAGLVPRGTHHVTARLHADDGTVWAVDGEPVESTADITASRPEPGEPSTGTGTGTGSRRGTDGGTGTGSASGSGSGRAPQGAADRRAAPGQGEGSRPSAAQAPPPADRTGVPVLRGVARPPGRGLVHPAGW
ncbi:nuclear transport factor 2 family protein [Streptomyces sp. NPDC059720]|uniref:nuclear transport factor 2 family protein n=1 Tax=Streptomyces sp. NPDC059720 TaxID=3346924 RepID=UPI00367FC46C